MELAFLTQKKHRSRKEIESKWKTEMCRNILERGYCQYGDVCAVILLTIFLSFDLGRSHPIIKLEVAVFSTVLATIASMRCHFRHKEGWNSVELGDPYTLPILRVSLTNNLNNCIPSPEKENAWSLSDNSAFPSEPTFGVSPKTTVLVGEESSCDLNEMCFLESVKQILSHALSQPQDHSTPSSTTPDPAEWWLDDWNVPEDKKDEGQKHPPTSTGGTPSSECGVKPKRVISSKLNPRAKPFVPRESREQSDHDPQETSHKPLLPTPRLPLQSAQPVCCQLPTPCWTRKDWQATIGSYQHRCAQLLNTIDSARAGQHSPLPVSCELLSSELSQPRSPTPSDLRLGSALFPPLSEKSTTPQTDSLPIQNRFLSSPHPLPLSLFPASPSVPTPLPLTPPSTPTSVSDDLKSPLTPQPVSQSSSVETLSPFLSGHSPQIASLSLSSDSSAILNPQPQRLADPPSPSFLFSVNLSPNQIYLPPLYPSPLFSFFDLEYHPSQSLGSLEQQDSYSTASPLQ